MQASAGLPFAFFGLSLNPFQSARTVNLPTGSGSPLPIDPSFRRIMVYLFIGTRGGQNRARIVESLHDQPSNPNQMSERLGLDYKTVQHHIKLLEQNGVIVSSASGAYGAMYFLTPYFEKYYDAVRGMWAKFGQS